MTREELAVKVIELIADITNKKVEEITPTGKLVEDIGMDDFNLVELVMELEATYGIQITDDEADTLITPEDIVSYVYSKVGEPKK